MQNLIKGTSLDKAQAVINQGWRNRGRQVQARGHEVPLKEHVSAKKCPYRQSIFLCPMLLNCPLLFKIVILK
ncbi:hypothetical protein ACHWQZ_G018567 [Mnemiopsis leidyi]